MSSISICNLALQLPQDFLRRRHLPDNQAFWLDERDGSLILHPRRSDAKKLYIEATTGCNLQCRTCIRNIWSDPDENMSRQTFERIIESIPTLPDLERVVFTSFGEPLTHPNILDMLEAVRRLNIKVTLGSNGLLLKPAIVRELIKLGVDRLMVSIDGASPETFAGVRGVGLAQVVDNLKGLNAIKRQMNSAFPSLGVEFVIMKSNVSELGDVAHLTGSLGVARVIVSNVLPYTEDMRAEVLYGYEPIQTFKSSSWELQSDAWVMWATQELPRMHWGAERRCRFVQDRAIVVGWDGGVSPCYALSHNYSYYAIDGCHKQVSRYDLGNVNQHSLADIWMSEDYTRFRSEVMGYHFPSCPDCDLRETCDLRKINEGCWGWNPSCADCLWSQDIIRCP